jgi:glycerate 2-kinase
MRIVIAPDSFKECLYASEVGRAMKKGILACIPDAQIDVLPMADGGEGTIEALLFATSGQRIELEASDPFGKRIKTSYGVLGDKKTAVIEMAKIAGLQVVTKRDPLAASTYGVGELISHAVASGYRKLIIGLGGSATNDGGMGMLQALGCKFLDADGQPVPLGGGDLNQITSVDFSGLLPAVLECEITIASDVENVLCGPKGATYVFGPQKGAQEEELSRLDRGLQHFASLVEEDVGTRLQHIAGAGAAGGLGFGLLAIGARIESGARIVAEAMKLEAFIKSADWVITGEGKSDFQSAYGKVPVHVAKLAKEHGVKAILISGALGKGYQELYSYFLSCQAISTGPMSLEYSMEHAEQLIYDSAFNMARIMKEMEDRSST